MRKLNFREAIIAAQAEEMRRDPDVIIFGEDVGSSGSCLGTCIGLREEFGADRAFDAPVAEAAQATFALGAAMAGKRVILEYMFGDIVTYAFDGIANEIAKTRYLSGGRYKIPIVIRAQQASGFFLGPQHSQNIESWFANVPGLKIVCPSSAKDLYGLLKASIRDDDPVLFLEDKTVSIQPVDEECPEEADDFTIPIGKAKIIREGTDVSIIGYGNGIVQAKAAAEQLAAEGINCEILDLVSLIPYDKEAIIKTVTKTGKAVVVHDSHKTGGFGGEIAAFIAEEAFGALKAPIKRVGALDIPFAYGYGELPVRISADRVKEAVLAIAK